jgi:hypothetical protein
MPDPTPPTDPIAPDARVAELETAVAALTRRAEVAELAHRNALADLSRDREGLVALMRDRDAIAEELVAARAQIERLTPPAHVAPALPSAEDVVARLAAEGDPAPGARYEDAENRAARALWLVDREASPELPAWEELEVPVRRRLMASAREYLASSLRSARLLRAALGA